MNENLAHVRQPDAQRFDVWIKASAFEWLVSRVNEDGTRLPTEPSGYFGAYLYKEDGSTYSVQIPLNEVIWYSDEMEGQEQERSKASRFAERYIKENPQTFRDLAGKEDPVVEADSEMEGQQ